MEELVIFAVLVVLFALAIGAMIGWHEFLKWYHARPRRVKTSQVVMSRPVAPVMADEQTDRADRPSVSADNLEVPRLQLDKTKTTLIEVMVYNGWQVGEIRSVLKGDNGVLGTEIDAARKRLGIEQPPRELRVRDNKGERVITF